MGALKWGFIFMLPGLKAAAIKMFANINVQKMCLRRIKNPDLKYWTKKYFWANKFILKKTVEFFKGPKNKL